MKNSSNSLFFSEQRGFTLIEVTIALVILVVGLLSIATMQVSAIKGNNLSDNITIALTLAEDKMEELLGLDYNNPELEDVFTGNNDDLRRIEPGWIDREELDIDETGKENSGHFRRIWNIADNQPVENSKTVSVIVLWDKDEHQISLMSVKRK